MLDIVPGKEERSVSDSIADDVESQVPPSCQHEDSMVEAFNEPGAFLAPDESGRGHWSGVLVELGVGAFRDRFVWVLVSQIGGTGFG